MTRSVYTFFSTILLLILLSTTSSAQTLPKEMLFVPWGDDALKEMSFQVEPGCRFGPQSFRIDAVTGSISILDPLNGYIKIFRDGALDRTVEAPDNARDFVIESEHARVFLAENQLLRFGDEGLVSSVGRQTALPLIQKIYSENGEVMMLNHDGSSSRLSRGFIEDSGASGIISRSVSYQAQKLSSSEARVLVGGEAGAASRVIDVPVTSGNLGCLRVIGADETGRIFLDIDLVERAVPLKVRREIWVIGESGGLAGKLGIPVHYYSRIFRDLELGADGTLYHMISSDDGIHIMKWTLPESGGYFEGEYPERFKREIHYNQLLTRESSDLEEYPRPLPGGVAADTVTRAEALSKADTYVQHLWTATSANISDGIVTAPDGDLVETPDWIVVGQNQHIPYKFGGVDELSAFDAGIASGNYAGDIQVATSSIYANGVDCSGFVCRCWNSDSDYSTYQMDDPAYGPITLPYVTWDEIQPGDAVHRHGHVRMAAGTMQDGTLLTVESAGSATGWKVDYSSYTLSELIEYSPRYYIHMEGLPTYGTIESAGSGSWTTGSTWVGGVVPDETDDVLINSGHTISVDDVNTVGRSISFGGNDALIDMNASSMLTVYGDFTLYSTSHNVFSAGWSGTDAYIKFAGAAVQTLSGFNTAGGSTSFRDVIVDKTGGKVTTEGVNMRLGIQNTLEIVSGMLELAEGDDLEGRWSSSGNFRGEGYPSIVIQAAGELYLADGDGVHHIRGDYEASTHLPIGTVTVYGKATFRDGSTYRINLSGVDIESGGKVITSLGMGGGEFDCGPLVIKDGGEVENYTTSDCWGTTAVVTLDSGGIFDTKASSTIFPTSFTNNGTVRYSRDGTTDQEIVDMDYHRLEISADADNYKNWDLAASRVISDSLKINYDGNLVLTAASAQTLTIGNMLHLSTGHIDNSDADVSVVLSDGALIKRVTGTISDAPVFAGTVDLIYASTSTNVTTGPEMPVGTGVLNDLELTGDEGMTFGADVTVNGTCSATGSDIFTDAYTLTLGPSATLVESDSITVVGTAMTTRTASQSVNEMFGDIGIEINAAGGAPGVTTVTRVTGTAQSITGLAVIERSFDVSPANNSGLDATVVFHYDETEAAGMIEDDLVLYNGSGAAWTALSSVGDINANTLTTSGLGSFETLTAAHAAGDLISSVAGGSWTVGTTWVGGVVPDSTDNVLINSGHTISVDDLDAMCADLSFGGDDALIDINASSMLTVYGDFTLFSTAHTVFSAGWSGTDAYIKFAGDSIQTLSGFNDAGGSTSFRDVIIDKTGGKVTTEGVNMRLGIQNSLEIVNGLLELAPGDDLEGRWASSGNFRGEGYPSIVIQEGGELYLADGDGVHHIRGDYEASTHLPIGTVTVYGKATFRDASTYRINLSGVDIESGGKVITSLGMGGGEFDCGPLVIKDGGEVENYTTSDCWGATAVVTLDSGGIFDTKASTTIFPTSFTNNGTVRYSREGTTDQEIVDMDYHRLEISLDEDNNKNWAMTGSRVISDSLKVNFSANLVLTAASAQTLTIGNMLHLSSGHIDNSDADVSLVLSDGVLIKRVIGTISTAPVFAGTVDLIYASTSTNVTTGPEMPVGTGVLNDLELTGDEGLTLGADVTVNDTCSATGSDIFTGAYTLTLGPAATLVESDSITVVGTAMTTRTASQSVNETFGNIGIEINAAGAAPGVTTVTRVTGTALSIDGTDGIERYFDISPVNNSGLDAVVVFHYDNSELNGSIESELVLYESFDAGGTWASAGGTVNETANTVTGTGIDAFSTLTSGADNTGTGVEDETGIPAATRLVSVYPNPFNPATRIEFDLNVKGTVYIAVYDVNGRMVRTLVNGVVEAGRHDLTWNGTNGAGVAVSSGVYFCRMKTANIDRTLKMVLLR